MLVLCLLFLSAFASTEAKSWPNCKNPQMYCGLYGQWCGHHYFGKPCFCLPKYHTHPHPFVGVYCGPQLRPIELDECLRICSGWCVKGSFPGAGCHPQFQGWCCKSGPCANRKYCRKGKKN